MENNLEAMNNSGNRLESIGNTIEGYAESASDDLNETEGNDGFEAMSAMRDAAVEWTGHVKGIGVTINDLGSSVISAAEDFGWTDDDNADHIGAANKPLY